MRGKKDNKRSDSVNKKDNKEIKKVKKSKPEESKPTPPEVKPDTTPLNDELMGILNERIYDLLKEDKLKNEDKQQITSELEHLKYIIQEYLDNFLLLGYTLNGTPFILSNSASEEKHNALVEHLRLTYMNTFKNNLF